VSKLPKAAWFNLTGMIVCVLVSSLGFVALTRTNARGVTYIVVVFVVGCVSGLGAYLVSRKRGFEGHLDERERLIYKRSLEWSAFAAIGFLGGVCIVPFFLLDGQNLVHAYYLPVIFLSALFAAQFVHSAAILVQCALEDDDA
jgi:uncharacterized membrane protein YfcA